jgi:hypothetical protein
MTIEDRFREGLANWRAVLASLGEGDVEACAKAFDEAAKDAAGDVAKGLELALAIDALYEMAQAHGLVAHLGEDALQTRIAAAFAGVRQGTSPGDPGNGPRPSGNGPERPAAPGSRKPPVQPIGRRVFMQRFTAPNYLVDGILQRRFIYALTGQTGHAKTAVALHLAELIASSDASAMFGTHRVEKGRVLYLVGENADDVRMRLIGSDAQRKDNPDEDQIWFIPQVFNIPQALSQIEKYIREIGDFSLVIVDTSAAYFLGDEEMSNTQMGNYARALRTLTTLPGQPCVLVLCHPIKYVTDPSQLLPRGGSAYLAEVDGNLTLWRTSDDVVELHHNKIRGPGFEAMSFKLETIRSNTLVDQKGRQIPTVRAVPISQREEEQHSDKVEQDEDRVLTAMLSMPAGEGGSFANWATNLGWVMGNGEAYRKKVERLINELEKKKPKLTTKIRNKWHLTDEGKDAARQAVLRFNRQQNTGSQKNLF